MSVTSVEAMGIHLELTYWFHYFKSYLLNQWRIQRWLEGRGVGVCRRSNPLQIFEFVLLQNYFFLFLHTNKKKSRQVMTVVEFRDLGFPIQHQTIRQSDYSHVPQKLFGSNELYLTTVYCSSRNRNSAENVTAVGLRLKLQLQPCHPKPKLQSGKGIAQQSGILITDYLV